MSSARPLPSRNSWISNAAFGWLLLGSTILAAPLAPGDPVPQGSLRNGAGGVIELAAALAGKPAVLVFYRGGWCPYCTRHLEALADVLPLLEQRGIQMIAISPDRPEVIRNQDTTPGLTLLSDSSMTVSQAFDLAFQVPADLVRKYRDEYQIDLEASSGETHHLLPHPAVYVVDAAGVIRFAHVNTDYRQRLDPGAIVSALDSLTP